MPKQRVIIVDDVDQLRGRDEKFEGHGENIADTFASEFDGDDRSRDGHLIRFRPVRLSVAVGKVNVSVGGGHNTLDLIALSSNTVGMIGEGNFNFERGAIQIG